MGLDQVIAERNDLVDGQLGSRVRVKQGRLVDIVLALGQRSQDGQFLHVDVGAS